jgi:hypothetical protein
MNIGGWITELFGESAYGIRQEGDTLTFGIRDEFHPDTDEDDPLSFTHVHLPQLIQLAERLGTIDITVESFTGAGTWFDTSVTCRGIPQHDEVADYFKEVLSQARERKLRIEEKTPVNKESPNDTDQ